jgi:hypothetical protein
MVKNFCNLTFWLQKGTYDMDGPVPGDQLVKTISEKSAATVTGALCRNM